MRSMTERAGFGALHPSVSRRQLLRIGGLGSLGLTLQVCFAPRLTNRHQSRCNERPASYGRSARAF